MKIAFDLDGVLVDMLEVFQNIVWQRHTKEVPVLSKHRIEIPGIESDQINTMVYSAIRRYSEMKPFPYVSQLLEKVYALAGEPVTIVTARPKKYASETFLLVERFCPVPFRISMVNSYSEKLKHLIGFDAFVEDRRKTALLLADAGLKVYLVDRSYNQCDPHPNITRIADLGEILDELESDEFVKALDLPSGESTFKDGFFYHYDGEKIRRCAQ